MAHNLYQNKMAYTGEVPWHKLGTRFDQEFTTTQAIEAAGLGFVVTKEPIYRKVGHGHAEVPGKFLTVNNDNQEILGLVGDRYEVLQNADAFGWFDEVMAETGARFQTAGALGNGERIWLMAKLPESFAPVFGDKVEQFCLLSTGHDGGPGSSVTIRFTPIRVVCQNTLTAATRTSREFVTMRHTESVQGRLKMTAVLIKDMREHFTRLGECFQEFAEFRIDDAWLDEFEKMLFGSEPTDKKTEASRNIWMRKIEMFDERLKMGKGVDLPGVAGTAWHAYNAAVEFADYDFPMQKKASESDRVQSILWGRANEFKQMAFNATMALIRR